MLVQSKPKILITGKPGCGKTTLIKKVVARLELPVHGFFTQELRREGKRIGFEIETFSKPIRHGLLSHIDIMSKYHVGKYGVDIENFERIALPEIELGRKMKTMIVIDEIGKMELLSKTFSDMLKQIFDSDIQVLATILYKSHPFTDNLKGLSQTQVIKIDQFSRDKLIDEIVKEFQQRAIPGDFG